MKAKLSSATAGSKGSKSTPTQQERQPSAGPTPGRPGATSPAPTHRAANGPATAAAAPADQRAPLPPLTPEEMRRQYTGACAALGSGAVYLYRDSMRGTIFFSAACCLMDAAAAACCRHPPLYLLLQIPQPFAAFSAADPLPLLRDVPAPDKPALFVRKLRLCAFSFDYSDPSAHVREKEVKRQTLLELVDYVNSGSGKFTEEVRVWVWVGRLALFSSMGMGVYRWCRCASFAAAAGSAGIAGRALPACTCHAPPVRCTFIRWLAVN